MVHIKKVEIFGFKSFGFRNIDVNLRPGLVSISGPNGSGKSNILDAIIFALGENRPRQMRAGKLIDLIHDVEGRRRGTRMTRSSVHFDNTDRKIPVDSDTVEITRELDEKGDNLYYLNKKKTQRSRILNILDLANAGLNQLNVVQQGTITRISEFSPDEKRESIENLIGLAYFDEKKDEAMKQLSEADRRLEISFARMDEIKKRIDSLEKERNVKLRSDLLQKEIIRFEAMSATSRLKYVKNDIESKSSNLGDVKSEIADITKQRDQLHTNSESLRKKKNTFMDGVSTYNASKSDIDTRLGKTLTEYEETKSQISTIEREITQIKNQLPKIQSDIGVSEKQISQLSVNVESQTKSNGKIEEQRTLIINKIQQIDLQINEILETQTNLFIQRSEIDKKIRALNTEINQIKLNLMQIETKDDVITNKITSNTTKSSSNTASLSKLVQIKTKLETALQKLDLSIDDLRSQLSILDTKHLRLEKEISDISIILEKSLAALHQYGSKIKTIKKIMHEDYTISKLYSYSEKLGIEGLVYEVLRWNKKFERAAMAVCSDWLKAVIVKDMITLLGISEIVHKQNLPRLKIIPLDTIQNLQFDIPNHPDVIGLLSDFIQCDTKFVPLKLFLFGGVLVVKSNKTASALSIRGFNTVTLRGEYFTANSKAMILDTNSKISNLTKTISMGTSVDGLTKAISLLKKMKDTKSEDLKKVNILEKHLATGLADFDTKLANSKLNLEIVLAKIKSGTDVQNQIKTRIQVLHDEKEKISIQNNTFETKIKQLLVDTSNLQNEYTTINPNKMKQNLPELNTIKSSLHDQQSELDALYKELSVKIIATESTLQTEKSKLEIYRHQFKTQSVDLTRLQPKLEKHNSRYDILNKKMIDLREKEQNLISTSGSSVEQIRDFDSVLNDMIHDESVHSRTINALEKQILSLERDIGDLKIDESGLQKRLDVIGVASDYEEFDVLPIQNQLQTELNHLTNINAGAPEVYLEITTGYRSMSERKNSLEKERNTIVKFIEDVEKDKRQTFLNAFDTVDKEIRAIFTKMTSGNAWLELQDEDNIFSSGISYMIQFPNKSKRESTSISGGEKTLAAVVFVLALQKLKPSPFYLFDEIDAHLDAPNSDRLAKILKERSAQSQFIMVSLKDSVIQMASLIYGVFPKNGVSHIVSYKDKRLSYLDA